MDSDLAVFLGFWGLVVYLIVAGSRRSARLERLALEARAQAEAARRDLARERATAQIADLLRQSDPDFDPHRFEERVSRAFLAVQRGRTSGDLRDARALVSDGVYERLVLELEDRRRRGPEQAGSAERDWQVAAVHVAHSEPGPVFDKLTVGIRALCEGAPHGEFWTFLRRHGAQTHEGPGLLERRCPNCSTPIEQVERAHCESCGALLRSGERDWVLAEITKPESWRPRAAARIPGIAALLATDPGFSPQHLEDCVGVLFWRLALAERERSGAARLVALADPDWCERFATAQSTLRRPSQLALAMEPELRSIEVAGVREVEGWHRVATTVAWSGRLPARSSHEPAKSLKSAHVFVLARRVGATTDPGQVTSSAHCARCGAPERESGRSECPYCGERRNDGRRSWILIEAEPARSLRAWEILLEFTTGPPAPARELELELLPEGAFPWVARLLGASGPIAAPGRQLLAELSARWDLDAANQTVDADIDPAKDEDFGPQPIRRALPVLADIAIAHDILGEGTRRVLTELGSRAGLTALDVRSQIDLREREWDGRAEAEREAAAKRERTREHLEWRRLTAEPRGPDE